VVVPNHPTQTERGEGKETNSTRTDLKHIGGYLDTDTVEKVAILRAVSNWIILN
jgi:hypothetical protein